MVNGISQSFFDAWTISMPTEGAENSLEMAPLEVVVVVVVASGAVAVDDVMSKFS